VSAYGHYAQYKVSSIEWCDQLPALWDSVTLRWVCSIYAGGTPAKDVAAYWEGGTVPWLNSGCVNQGLVLEASEWITESALKKSSAKWISRGNLVMALAGQGKTKGMVAQLGIDATCNQSLAAIVPTGRISTRYLFWWLDSNYQNVRNMAGGDLRDGLNLELLASISCPAPPQGEQAQIARFLDYETTRIDALIEKQQQLVALLKERRQAVISHAVTKGLNPNAPLRDPGVEWLGMVPAHWEVRRLKRISDKLQGRLIVQPQRFFADDGVPIVFGYNIKNGRIDESGLSKIAFDVDRQYPHAKARAGDVYTVRLGDPGATAVVTPSLDGCHFASIMWIHQNPRFCSEWLAHCMNSQVVRRQVESVNYGAAQTQFNISDAVNFLLPFPPLAEQQHIAAFLEEAMIANDAQVSKAEDMIALLHERRTAIISAAVTGKIDVRSWAPPNSNAEQDVA